MKSKVSTLITVSNFLFLIVLGVLWWYQQQKTKPKAWQSVTEAMNNITLDCGQRQVVYTNTGKMQEMLDFTFINHCSQQAAANVGKGDSVLKPGTTVNIGRGQKIKSTYELAPGESFICESISDSSAIDANCQITWHVIAVK